MIVVSHRGPFGFSVGDHGELRATRGAGGLAGTLNHLVASGELADATCLSASLTPGDDRIARGEAHPEVGTKVCFVELDPEGFKVWDETEAARDGDRDIYLLSNLHQVGSVQINAFQRIANVVLQKSLREGFGLTVSEALWKGRPVIGGRAGGIKLQIRDGFDGYLVDSVEECAQRTIELLADPVGADALGAQGREHVREHFLSTRELQDWLTLFGTLRK